MKILIAPLNWGLGHAARCLPLIIRHLRAGDEVVIAGDGESLSLLRKHFPGLRSIELPALHLRYSRGNRQVGAMLLALPKLLHWARKDHQALADILQRETFDLVISDNRLGFYISKHRGQTDRCPRTAYITHQLLIPLPSPWKWLQPLAHKIHLRIIRQYDECLIPDYEGEGNLSGALAHYYPLPPNARFIGPLSRFAERTRPETKRGFHVVAVLSGLEPQRSLLEEKLLSEWMDRPEQVLIVRGLPHLPPMNAHKHNITLVPYLSDAHLAAFLLGADQIIARSGYSTIMDLATLGILGKATLIPTPGQPEQEYLAKHLNKHSLVKENSDEA